MNEITAVSGADGALRVAAIDADLLYWPALLPAETADRWMAAIAGEVKWERHEVRIAGRNVPCPRLSAWHGDEGAAYAYSGTRYLPRPWSPALREARALVEQRVGARFNSVLLNLYRDGADGMGWHADDEPELGRRPVIASLSLGAARRFRLRHRQREATPIGLELAHGSLLLMRGNTQHCWQHALAKTRRTVGPRLNLTFRWLQPR